MGSGAAGMTAALTAAAAGARVTVLEKTDSIGGTTSYSEAMIWVPCSAQAIAAGVKDSPDAAIAYLADVAGNRLDPQRAEALVSSAPRMLKFLEAESEVRYRLATGSVDYYPDKQGATSGARALSPGSFDGRRLGEDFRRLRQPLGATQILGGMTISGADLPHFYRVFRSWESTLRVARLTARYARDRVQGWPRGTAIANGDGIIAALLMALKARGGEVITGAPVVRLIREGGRVVGVVARIDGTEVEYHARKGVILAGGGFSADPGQRARFAPEAQKGGGYVSLVAEGATGDGLRLGEEVGGALDLDVDQPLAWAPSSWVPHLNSGFPHFMERAKPGIIVVDRRGRRFVNEAKGYHDFVPAMIRACRDDERVEAWIIADHRAQRRYGLGAAPPAPGRLGPALKSGYLVRRPTLEALAEALGIAPGPLSATVTAFNVDARKGVDSQFCRGQSAHNRAYGDPAHGPNPCLGALETGPFYAVRLHPGDLGSFTGLATNADAQVLDKVGKPVPGLYAAGLDATSVLGGFYPAAGVTVGSAMTFGWIAARHAMAAGTPAETKEMSTA